MVGVLWNSQIRVEQQNIAATNRDTNTIIKGATLQIGFMNQKRRVWNGSPLLPILLQSDQPI
jgi:hypothetical protein